MVVEQEIGQTGDGDFVPQDVARGILETIRKSADKYIFNYFYALSGEWKALPGLGDKVVVGRLALERGLNLDIGSFYSDSGDEPYYINYDLLRSVLQRRFNFDFKSSSHVLPQQTMDLVLGALGELIVNTDWPRRPD